MHYYSSLRMRKHTETVFYNKYMRYPGTVLDIYQQER